MSIDGSGRGISGGAFDVDTAEAVTVAGGVSGVSGGGDGGGLGSDEEVEESEEESGFRFCKSFWTEDSLDSN